MEVMTVQIFAGPPEGNEMCGVEVELAGGDIHRKTLVFSRHGGVS